MKYLLFLLFVATGLGHINGQSDNTPSLVVVIAVDQMQQDFFDRFGSHFEGGLKRLWDSGVVFDNAHHDHYPTNTAPGHAAIATGKYPSKHGIVNNSFYDRIAHEEAYCVGDPDVTVIGVDNNGSIPARSPRNLKSTTFADWIKKKYTKTRVFSVSKKDRTAVLLGGQNPDQVYWLDALSTKFVTSTYYTNSYPAWADQFVIKDLYKDEILAGWNKKLPESAYAHLRPDNYEYELGAFLPDFPHTMDRVRPGVPPSQRLSAMVTATPMADKYVLDFAEQLVINENVGKQGSMDMLMVGCSGADAIGHHFGPESHEVMDYYMWLDEYLGDFMDFLDGHIGSDNYWTVLVSDHGVIPMPEALKDRGLDARRILPGEVLAKVDSIEKLLQAEFNLTSILIEELMGGIYINYIETDARAIKRKDIRTRLAEEIRKIDYVEDTYTIDDFKTKTNRPYLDIYRRSYYRDLSPDIYLRLKENYLAHGPVGTTHGSVYDYDTHVPIIFSIPGTPHAVHDRRVETVDIAPTLSAMLGVKPDKKVDGEVLRELVPGT